MHQVLLDYHPSRREAKVILAWLEQLMGPMLQTAPRAGNEGTYVIRQGRWRPIWWENELGGVMFYDPETSAKDAMMFKLRWY